MKVTKSDLKWIVFAALLMTVLCLFGHKAKAQDAGSVYRYLTHLGVKHADIVTAQAVLETGNFQCANCALNTGNIFGFRTKDGYLEFCSWDEACTYYAWWQAKHYRGGDYYSFLTRIGYAEDPNYIKKLKQIVYENKGKY